MSGHEVDLHTHSLRSDGVLTPAELVARAGARGVRVLAVSDHDTLSGIADAAAAGERHCFRVIPAVEINTESEWGDAHVLGYFVDPDDAVLEQRLSRLREHRIRRIELIIGRLTDLGYPVTLARVLEIAQGGALGRPHLAAALAERGLVPSFEAAFTTVIAKDAPAYVPRVGLEPREAVELIRARGGVSSLAHPGTVKGLTELLPLLVTSGLAGLECHYGSHSPAWTAECLALAGEHGLIATGGSDFHGRGEHGAELGGVFVPPECLDALEAVRPNGGLPSRVVGRES
ncbi:PHP domain-containing protein [soil metagenome]